MAMLSGVESGTQDEQDMMRRRDEMFVRKWKVKDTVDSTERH